MNFSINKKMLLNRVKAANKVILSKNTLPILDTILVVLKENKIEMTAGDGENTLTQRVCVESMSEDTTFCIDGKKLESALCALDGDMAVFDVDGKTATLHAEKEHYVIPLFNADEYPLTPEVSADSSRYVVSADILNEACRLAKPFVANDELRPVMNGILFEATPEGITFVATDGHKLIRRTYKDVKSECRSSVIVSMKASSILATFAPLTDVTITSDGHRTCFEAEDIRLTSVCIEGRYPNYNSVIPQNSPYTIEVNRNLLAKVVANVGSFGDLATNLTKLRMTTFMGGATEMEVSAQDLNFSTSAAKSLAVTHDAPENFAIGVRGYFLRTLLASHSSSEVVMKLIDASRAIVMLDKDPAPDTETLTLLMPMMLND